MSKANVIQFAALALIAGAICLVYGRALNAPFLFDDAISVANNASIRQVWPLVGEAEHSGPLNPPKEITTSGRPLVNLSLAINYHFGQLDPFGYHVFNLIVHVLSAWLVMAIVRRMLRLDYFEGKFDRDSGGLALVVALLWSVHPLQTETVVYVTQRTELMVGFFYLATLYASLRYWDATSSASRNTWLTLATGACFAGMACKEVMVTAPLVVLLFERTFISGSFWQSLRKSWPLYVGLFLSWGLLYCLNRNAPRSESAGFNFGVSAYAWWFTQAKVLLLYLKLIFWPWPLAIHYDIPYLTTFGEAWPWLVPVMLLGVATLVLLWRRGAIGFVGAWVFMILSPTFVVPIITEVAAERRMYLPLAAMIALLVVAVYRFVQQAAWRSAVLAVAAAFVLAIVLGALSVNRLNAYRDERTLWQDAIIHQPGDYLAHNNFGKALSESGKFEEAIVQYQESLRLNPKYYPAHNNLGAALNALGRSQEAIPQIMETLRLNPNYDLAYINLGNVLSASGRKQEAIESFQHALRLNPDSPEAHINLGSALQATGKLPEATAQYQAALKLKPNFAEAYNNLGTVLEKTSTPQAAIEQYRQALRWRPAFPEAHSNLAHASLQAGQLREAVEQYREALQLMPKSPSAHNDLGLALLNVAQPKEAMDEFQQALRLKQDFAVAHANLAIALDQLQRGEEALAAAQTALDLARSQKQDDLVQEIDEWLTKYRASHPDLPGKGPAD